MGAINSRRMLVTMNDYQRDDEDSTSRIEDTSDDSDTMDSDSDYAGEHFVAMLRNLITRYNLPGSLQHEITFGDYSGQLLLQNGEDDDDYPSTRRPRIKVKPNTSILDKSEFSVITKQASGLLDQSGLASSNNVATLLGNRERGVFKHSNFLHGVRCKLSNQYVPNEMVETLDDTSGKVFCGIFSPDGNTFLTASQDRHIKLYNSKDCSYKMVKNVKARDVGWSIIDVAFNPDGDQFVYSTWSSSLHMCPVYGSSDHQEPLSLLNTGRRFCVFSVVFSSDGRELVCGANDGCLYVYDIERKKRTFKIVGHEYDVNRVLFADNTSQIIYSGGDDGLVKVWDRRTLDDRNAKPVGLLAGHMDGITYIDSRGDGRYLISNSKDQSIKLWDVRVFSDEAAANESLKAVRNQPWDYRWQGVPKELYQDHKLEGDTSIMTYRGHVVSKTLIRARFSPAETTGQRFIYTGCGYGRVVIYDSLTGKIVKQKKGHMGCVRDVSWHPTRNEILTSSWDGLVGKWVYSKTRELMDKQVKKEERKPVRRSARLAALRQRAQTEPSDSVDN